jgi:hypothetical protein
MRAASETLLALAHDDKRLGATPAMSFRANHSNSLTRYLASLRLIRSDPRIAAWFRARAGYRGGHKLVAIVAVIG